MPAILLATSTVACDSGAARDTAATATASAAAVGPQPGAVAQARMFEPAGLTGDLRVAVGADGTLAAAGAVTGRSAFGEDLPADAGELPGDRDIFVARLDATGAPLMSRRMGGTGDDVARGVAMDARGAMYVTGHIEGDASALAASGRTEKAGGPRRAFVLKLEPDGTTAFVRLFETVGSSGARITLTSAGEVVVAGSFGGETITLGDKAASGASCPAGRQCVNLFTAQLDAGGKPRWLKAHRGTGARARVGALVVDGKDRTLLAGDFTGALDFGGSSPLISQTAVSEQVGETDVFVAALGPAGDHRWSMRFGDAGAEHCHGIAVDRLGQPTLVGAFAGGLNLGGGELVSAGLRDGFVAQLDGSGKHLRSFKLGDRGDDAATTVAVDARGHVVLGGHYQQTFRLGESVLPPPRGESDHFVAELDDEGKVRWARALGAQALRSQDQLLSLGLTAAGEAVAVAAFSSSLSMPGATLQARSQPAAAWLKLARGPVDGSPTR